jgi:hypothetical protein
VPPVVTEAIDIAIRIAGGIGIAGILVALIGKKVTPRRSPAEQHDSVVAELAAARVQNATERTQHNAERETWRQESVQLRAEMAQLRSDASHDLRLMADYAFDLRAYIASGGKPPPPDWPEGLRL